MNSLRRKIKIGSGISAVIVVGAGILGTATPALATSPSTTNLLGANWRVWNAEPSTNFFWDINKAQSDGNGGIEFPIQTFESTSSGSFAVYLETNYNTSLAGTTITATANWDAGAYTTRSTVFTGAYARAEFQDVSSGRYTSNDYWWYSGSVLDLNGATSGTITAPMSDRANWTNVCGQVATDTTPHPGPNCVGGTDPNVSPYDGFTNAMQSVKQVNLAFGSAGSYASGVATTNPDPATFDVSAFDITH